MAGQSSVMFGWSWTKVSFLGTQVFGQASKESCDNTVLYIGDKQVMYSTRMHYVIPF